MSPHGGGTAPNDKTNFVRIPISSTVLRSASPNFNRHVPSVSIIHVLHTELKVASGVLVPTAEGPRGKGQVGGGGNLRELGVT